MIRLIRLGRMGAEVWRSPPTVPENAAENLLRAALGAEINTRGGRSWRRARGDRPLFRGRAPAYGYQDDLRGDGV